jgi:hypothetical protein
MCQHDCQHDPFNYPNKSEEHYILLSIQKLLNGTDWSADTIEKIARIMHEEGYEIDDLPSETNSVSLTYIAHNWQNQPCVVKIQARGILESRPELSLYLVARATGWAVYYGLQETHHQLLTDAAKEYKENLAHAENNLGHAED